MTRQARSNAARWCSTRSTVRFTRNEYFVVFEPTELDEPVSFGVVAFEVEPLVREETGAYREWNRTVSEEVPEMMRLRLVVARRELVGKLRSAVDWDASPLLGTPAELDRSPDLELFEVMQPFAHED